MANDQVVALLDFQIPRGLRMQISSLAAPNFATSYTLGSVGVVDGSVSYLYSSLPLRKEFKTSHIDLQNVIRGYKHVQELRRPDENWFWEVWHAGQRIDRKSEAYHLQFHAPQLISDSRHPVIWSHIPPSVQARSPVPAPPHSHPTAQDRCRERLEPQQRRDHPDATAK